MKLSDANPYHHPAGAPGGKGGQFAPKPGGAGEAEVGPAVPKTLGEIGAKLIDRVIGPHEATEEDAAEVASLLDGAVPTIYMPAKSLDSVLDDGRFKTARELGSTTRGYFIEERLEWEQKIFSPEIKDGPVYGFMSKSGSNRKIESNGYGDTIIEFKPDVLQNSTITFGDSLDTNPLVYRGVYGLSEENLNEYVKKMARPSLPVPATDRRAAESAYARSRFGSINGKIGVPKNQSIHQGYDYVELQLWQPPTTSQIARVKFMDPRKNAVTKNKLKKKLDALGIPWEDGPNE